MNPAGGSGATAAESMIRWVESKAAQIRNSNGAIEAFVIPVEDWRQMRSTLRAMTAPHPRPSKDRHEGGGERGE